MSSLQPLPPPTRTIPIGDARNFRHMGGYRSGGGGLTRSERLFRTGWFPVETAAVAQQIDGMAIRHAFDFRNDAERAGSIPPFTPGPHRAVSALGIDRGSMGRYLAELPTLSAERADTKAAMTRMFYEILDEGRDAFSRFLARAAQSGGPIVIMCTLGKDRTGVAAALLLSALGVSRADIMEDFMMSAAAYADYAETFARRARFAERGIDLDRVRDMLTVHPEYLEAVWQRAEEIAGGVDALIRCHLGISHAERDTLIANFTV